MTSTEANPAATGLPEKAKPQSAAAVRFSAFADMVKARTPEFAKLLPKHMPPERFARHLLNYAIRAPEVLECQPASILKSMLDAAQMGLAPDGLLGSGYLVTFKNKDRATGQKVKQCQFIPGYRGLIDLARRSGVIQQISGQVVRKGDVFEYELGDAPRLRHVPLMDTTSDEEVGHRPIVAAYAVALLTDGSKQVEVLTVADLQKIQGSSQSGASEFSPWAKWPEEMARKSAVKRLCKYLPLSPELALAIQHDNEVESGRAAREVEVRREVESGRAASGQRMAELAAALADTNGGRESGDDDEAPAPAAEGGAA